MEIRDESIVISVPEEIQFTIETLKKLLTDRNQADVFVSGMRDELMKNATSISLQYLSNKCNLILTLISSLMSLLNI